MENVRWVRLVFVDVFGGSHAVVVPAHRYQVALEKGAPFDGSALAGRARHFEEDMVLQPDAASFLDLGDGVGRVTCIVAGPDGRPWLGDPRSALVRVVDHVASLAASYRAAAELEFYLLRPDGQPVDRGGYFSELEGAGLAVTRAAAERLGDFGLDVVGAHLESGPGQYEIDLGSLPPLPLADGLVLTKQVLREEAGRAGLRVTFMARPFSGEPGSGLHLHQDCDAAAAEERLFDSRGALSAAGKAFLAGQLAHGRGLCALAAPNVNSYKRLGGGPEAPHDLIWGHLNRAALLRVGESGERRPAIEFRLADPSANPYLLVAGLLAAAGHGLDAGLDPGPPFEEDIGGFDPAARAVQVRPLPRDLDGALDALMADDVLVDAFDSRLLSPLVDGRRQEAEQYRAHVTAWETEHYLDEA
ncbi:MAG: glutamine synthetase family protein [Acidimicrobiales bacterium]